MKFSNDAGKFTYNVLEKHEKNSTFKFVKFDAWFYIVACYGSIEFVFWVLYYFWI